MVTQFLVVIAKLLHFIYLVLAQCVSSLSKEVN